MDALLLCLHLAAWLALALALVHVRARPYAIGLLAVAALAGIAAGCSGDEVRTLTTAHTYAAFEPAALEVSMVAFKTGTFTAPGWQWPVPFALFAAVWIVAIWLLGRQPTKNALVLPLLFAWSAAATWLAMQWCAAPEDLVQPVGLDRFLWPAGLATGLLAAQSARRFWVLLIQVSAAIVLARLPVALFSKYASDAHLGTVLDISSVRDIVNPMTQMQFSPRLAAGSPEQQFWLIWLEHVIFFPAVYLLSIFGIAFGAWMFHRHGPEAK